MATSSPATEVWRELAKGLAAPMWNIETLSDKYGVDPRSAWAMMVASCMPRLRRGNKSSKLMQMSFAAILVTEKPAKHKQHSACTNDL